MNKGTLRADIKRMPLRGDLKYPEWIQGPKGDPGDTVAGDYETLRNKPKINSVVLSGNKEWLDLGISELDALEVAKIWKELI